MKSANVQKNKCLLYPEPNEVGNYLKIKFLRLIVAVAVLLLLLLWLLLSSLLSFLFRLTLGLVVFSNSCDASNSMIQLLFF